MRTTGRSGPEPRRCREGSAAGSGSPGNTFFSAFLLCDVCGSVPQPDCRSFMDGGRTSGIWRAENPANNEVPARYIGQGLAETGAVNMVTGMILDYRAFDTFGESCVLFIASCCVMALLRIDVEDGNDGLRRMAEENDRLFEPKNDVILQKCASVLVPVIFLFGIYIVLNGHLSPGGGFSGGAVLGSGLILYLNAFGFRKTERFFTEKGIPAGYAGGLEFLLPRQKLFLFHGCKPP